ncbi:MAG: S8 family serine peptidase [Chloroherpetonaceae bacterium]|nr:S8 family serine peptidase [Chloroherpetonaceae bacterium]MDW8020576.1 S8 family serine peptidase [Chloroherpetonaceae bacterium]
MKHCRKNYVLLLPLFFFALLAQAQENPFYYYKGQKMYLSPLTSEVMVKYRESVPASQKARVGQLSRRLASVLMEPKETDISAYNTVRYTLQPNQRNQRTMDEVIAELKRNPDVESVYPAYQAASGDTVWVTNEIVFSPKTPDDPAVTALLRKVGVSIFARYELGDQEQFYAKVDPSANVFEIANLLQESQLFNYAEPNFTMRGYLHQETPKQKTPDKTDPLMLLERSKDLSPEERVRIKKEMLRQAGYEIHESPSAVPAPRDRAVLPTADLREETMAGIARSIADETRTIPDVSEPDAPRQKAPKPQAEPRPDYSSLMRVNDPLFPQQWWLNNTGQTGGVLGADINALGAWALTFGNSTIVVGITDAGGYDLDHPELVGKIVDSYRTFDEANPALPRNADSNHGTPCAGIIGARTDNGFLVASGAPNVRLLLIDIASTAPTGGSFNFTQLDITRMATRVINTPGVVALSNSWGGGVPSAAQEASFNAVRSQSRGRLGAVVLFSAGNGGTSTVGYPARAANMIAVGSSTHTDTRASYSQFGTDLDIVAPGDFSGIATGILTIDRQGTAGYSTGDVTFFGGTSASCPIAASVVGMIASVRPSLRVEQLEAILQSTTDKAGFYSYASLPDRPFGTWNIEMGYGRVNARKAILAALGFLINITEPATAVLKGQPTTIRWSVVGNLDVPISIDLLRGRSAVLEIASNLPASTRSFTFTPPTSLPDGNDYAIRIRAGVVTEIGRPFALVRSVLLYTPEDVQIIQGTYSDLGSSGDAISVANNDDANSAPQNIGFPFNFNGTTFTQFVLNTNGFIKLGNAPPSRANLFITDPADEDGNGGALTSTHPADINILSVMNHDLEGGTLPAEYRVHTVGTAPNRVCIIQFKNVRDKAKFSTLLNQNHPEQYNNMNFQIRLYENGIIEFVYGTFSPSSNPALFKAFGVGIKHLDASVLQTTIARKTSAVAWTGPTFRRGTGSLSTFNHRNNVLPTAGITYRFVPRRPVTQFAITNITPASPIANVGFSATVELRDAFGVPQAATTPVTVTIDTRPAAGTGTVSGNRTVTIPVGQRTGTISGLIYNRVENGVRLRATATGLPSVTSAPFNVVPPPVGLANVDFVPTEFPPTGWEIFNPDNSITWTRNATGRTNPGSAFINFYTYSARGQFDALISTPFTVPSGAFLRFDVAYAVYPGYADTLEIRVSTDGGRTYPNVIYYKGGNDLATRPSTTSSFVPTATEWRTEWVNLSAFAGRTVRIAFIGVNDFGNNLYLDNIATAVPAPPTQLAFVAVPTAPIPVGAPFSVSVELRDNTGSATISNTPVAVTLSRATGTGTFGGTLTGTIPAGQTQVTISGITYNQVGSASLLASASGLASATSPTLSFVGTVSSVYTRSSASTTYTPITTTPISFSNPDDGVVTVALPFSFNYLGTSYTSLNICTNGFVNFGTASTSYFNENLFTTSAPFNVLAPWWDDLLVDASPTSAVRTAVSGTAPNRVVIIQFENVRDYYNAPPATALRLNFQIRLYETSNVIEFIYGPTNGQPANSSSSASIGIKGPVGGPGDFMDGVTGSTTTGVSNRSSAAFPTSGTIYRFTSSIIGTVATARVVPAVNHAAPSTMVFDGTNLTIRANVLAAAPITVEYIQAAPSGGALPSGIVVLSQYYWRVLNGGATIQNATVSVPLSALQGVLNSASIRWLGRTTPNGDWQDLGGTVINGHFVSTVPVNDFFELAIGSRDFANALPVELASFTAVPDARGVKLEWTTASEKNNAGFEVERLLKRAGQDAAVWEKIGFVKGKGTTTEAQSYSFVDRTASGTVQYRLRQIDFDGTFEYSPIVEVDAGLPRTFELAQNYPNPFNPSTAISYQLPTATNVVLKVYDMLGREVATLVNARQEAGRYQVTFNATNLASGIYFYRLQAGSFVETKKMMLVK